MTKDKANEQKKHSEDKIMEEVTTEDLLKFGIIPELIGRLPVTAPLNPLDEKALIDILTKPKNALVKQYQKMFAIEGVELVVDEEALHETARLAIRRGSGARGLRSIFEEVLLDVMYDLPEDKTLKKCIIDAQAIQKKRPPILIHEKEMKESA